MLFPVEGDLEGFPSARAHGVLSDVYPTKKSLCTTIHEYTRMVVYTFSSTFPPKPSLCTQGWFGALISSFWAPPYLWHALPIQTRKGRVPLLIFIRRLGPKAHRERETSRHGREISLSRPPARILPARIGPVFPFSTRAHDAEMPKCQTPACSSSIRSVCCASRKFPRAAPDVFCFCVKRMGKYPLRIPRGGSTLRW